MWIDHRKKIRIFLAYESLYGGLVRLSTHAVDKTEFPT